MKEKRIGFIGLGIMGRPMAKHLVDGGCRLMVSDIDLAAVEELVTYGAVAATAAQIGQDCEIVFTILPNGAVVQQVLFGEGGVASTIQPGALVVDMSSVTPGESKACAQQLETGGVGFLDAPVSGGEPGAVQGTLAFMCGGTQKDFERAVPYFKCMGTSIQHIGECGSGSITKLANQIIVNLTIATVSEAMVLAAKAGVDPDKVYRAIRGGLAGSTVLDAKAPMMLARDFTPGGKISVNHKDIKNVLETAHAIDVPLPLTAQLFEILQALKAGGHMDDDHSGIVQYFEKLAGVTVGKEG